MFVLAEFAYNNSFQASIDMTLFEAIYGRPCISPVCGCLNPYSYMETFAIVGFWVLYGTKSANTMILLDALNQIR